MDENTNKFRLESMAEPSKLVLLDDSPAGADGPASVAFNHELYADLLRDILNNNKPGICVGFFARWGQGKSTVINLLANALGEKIRMVVFNAYQARGDSVRRQMLLAILRSIDPKRAKDFERFSSTITPLELASAEQQQYYSDRNIIKLLFLKNELDWFLVVSACTAIICAVVFVMREWQVLRGTTTFAESHDLIIWLGGIVAACSMFVARKFQERKSSIIAYTQPASESQRLKYPEQFAQVFVDSVQRFCKASNKRLILVVDDLDRCEPATVVEALASVRQFCHGAPGTSLDCQFVIPCDEGQMVSALEADGYVLTKNHTQYHNYSNTEMLRKFFDIVVRMDEIVPESMADFAAEQAGKIGVAPELARDMVDAAGIREPRKVKSLLNAFRIAHESVFRSQARELLPDPKQLERFEYTLALLVCFQELAPVAFAAVKENPEILALAALPDHVESVAKRIYASLTPVSVTTADVLITKQNEPSLRGLPQAHSLPAADRAGRTDEVVKIISEADETQQSRLIGWVCRKLRDATSGVRVKHLISYILDFGLAKGWDSPALRPVISVLNKRSQHLKEGLRLGTRLKVWGDYCCSLPPHARQIYDRVVLENYLTSPDSQPDEEKFILRFADCLTQPDAQRVRDSIATTLFLNASVSHVRLIQISDNLPEVEKCGCYGFAPQISEKLFKLLIDPRNLIGEDLHLHCLKVGLRFFGGDVHVANALLTDVVEQRPNINSPADMSEQFLKLNGVFFGLLRGVLASQTKYDRFENFFLTKYQPWINAQAHPHGRLRVLTYIQPGWGFLSERTLNSLAVTIAKWFWEDESFAKEGVATIDTPARDTDSWLKNRDVLRKSIFSNFTATVQTQSNLTPAAKRFLTTVKAAEWKVQELAETILSDKVKRLNPNTAGRPNNITEWCDFLKPICTENLQTIAEAVREALASTSSPQELIQFALATVWRDSIPADCSAALADILLRSPGITLGVDAFGGILVARSGFSEVARVLLSHIPGKGADWMHTNKAFMIRLSEFSTSDPKLAMRFQTVVDALLTANRDDYFTTGLHLLANQKNINTDVKSSIASWLKPKPESDPVAKQAREISGRPDLQY